MPASTPRSPFRDLDPPVRDGLCFLVLAVTCLLLRVPSLDRVSLNPDESQYEATASYLAATGSSAFLPYGTPGTFLVFKIMTQLFGPYPMFEVRVLVQLICLGVIGEYLARTYQETKSRSLYFVKAYHPCAGRGGESGEREYP